MTGAPPVRVAHVITRLDVGGAQETAVRICAGLDRARFSPLLISGPDEGSGGTLRPAAQAAGIDLAVVSSLHGPIRPGADRRSVGELADLLRAERVGLVQTHSSKAGVIGRLAARRAGVAAVVHTVHGWSFNDRQAAPVAWAYRAIERRMARRCAALVVVTTADRETGLRLHIGRPDQYVLIRSGIALDAGATLDSGDVRRSLGWGDDDLVVISVGRLEEQKDPLTLVAGFVSARARVPHLRLALVGDGSLADAVRAAAAAAGVEGAVDLLGLRDDVPDLLAAADLFALSSRWEGLPRAVLEAQRAGLPVVATDTGGVREVIADGVTGRLVPVGDVDALASALVDLADDPGRAAAMAHAGQQQVPRFSEAGMVADTEALYDRLLAGRPASDPEVPAS